MTLEELKARLTAREWKQWAAQFAYEEQLRSSPGEGSSGAGQVPAWMMTGGE